MLRALLSEPRTGDISAAESILPGFRPALRTIAKILAPPNATPGSASDALKMSGMPLPGTWADIVAVPDDLKA